MTTAVIDPGRLALGGLVAMAAAVGIGRFIYTPILPLMVEDLHFSKGDAGLIAAANFLGYLAGALAAAAGRGHDNPRRLLLAALAGSAATTTVMAASDKLGVLLVWRFMGGVASAYALVLASALVLERLSASGHGRLSAVHFSGVGTGIAVSAAATWILAATGFGWRAMWLAGGALSALAIVAAAALIGDAPSTPSASAGSLARHSGSARLKLWTVAYGLFGFGYVITATFIVAIVRTSSTAAAMEPVFWLVLGLSAVPSVALWVSAGRRMGVMPAFAAACLVEAAGVFASVVWPNVAGLLVASVLVGGTFMGLTALGLIGARDLTPDRPQRAVGILTASFGLGQIVGPVVAGYGFDLTGSFFLPSMLAVVALVIGAGLAILVDDRRTA